MAPSLKGITSTNGDPSLCAVCSAPFPTGCYMETSAMMACCGKRICLDCEKSASSFEATGSGAYRCSFCKRPEKGAVFIGVLKKQAKRGQPWAQFLLGMYFSRGRYMAQSAFDAVRWYRKAAAQGHPEAYLRLGHQYRHGHGCSKDLSEARSCIEKGMLLDANLIHVARELLAVIGGEYIDMKTDKSLEEAKLILVPLAKAGIANAQHNLGLYFVFRGDSLTAEKWFASAVSSAEDANGSVTSSYLAFRCCEKLGKTAQSRYWLCIAIKHKDELTLGDKEGRIYDINAAWAKFRKLRDSCGGCGAVLEGKMRKICKQCKAYCYCDRECQKLHWNKKDGHRDDCMGVANRKEMMKKANGENKSSSN